MLTPKQILLICFLLLSFTGISQDYNYIHYTNKDGLASNSVYAACQNKDGYIFFATTYGLCRFDGKVFTTFTVADGLTDNDILNVIPDSKGRVWMLPFAKSLCYYFKGKIYNSSNDTILKTLVTNDIIRSVFEDRDSNIVFHNPFEVIVLTPRNQLKYVTKDHWGVYFAVNRDCRQNKFDNGLLIMSDSNKLFSYKNDVFTFLKKINIDENKRTIGEYIDNNLQFSYLTVSKSFVSYNEVDGRVSYVNTADGAWKVDSNKITNIHYLPNIKIYNTFKDIENNIWFSTFGDGIYKLSAAAMKTFETISYTPNLSKEIFCISKYQSKVIGGMENFKSIEATNNKFDIISYQKLLPKGDIAATHKLNCIYQFSNTITLFVAETVIIKKEKNKKLVTRFFRNELIKSVTAIDDKYILVCTHTAAKKVGIKDLKEIETIWDSRCTRGCYFNNNYYIGTTEGLYEIAENKTISFLGAIHPALKRRITDIKLDNAKNLWIATSDAGIVSYKDGSVTVVINETNGLLSNVVNALHYSNNSLWVSTIKGINKIDLTTQKVVARYTTSDGLPSDIINAIYVDTDSTVWVGSPEGLTSFKEKEIASTSICNLVMQKIIVSNNNLNIDSNNFSLKYQDNNIQFQFVGISFRSGEEITYNYRLRGLTEDWKTTKERILDFPSLPYDKTYNLEIFATNKFGVKSKTINFNFYVATPFWKTNWFTALIFLLGFAIMFGFIYWRYKRLQARNYERANFKVQLANMEQQALQAQMNPHFIFNCLNSIQQFILFKETEKANKYLILFSRLIRNTLDNSDKKTITLADEKIYLEQYLELEQMRFGDKFTYTINIESSIDIDEIMLPAMLLQPFLENSLRHGIRQLKERNGTITIEFKQRNNYLYCHIKDDGIGREAAEKLKTNMHIEYQSKGVNLTNKRVELLNTNLKNKINIEMIDCKDEIGIATGTKVIVMIPINLE